MPMQPASETLTTNSGQRIEIEVPPGLADAHVDPDAYRRAATLLYTLMATGMRESEANRRLRNEFGPRYEG
jgi:hypothetical protein